MISRQSHVFYFNNDSDESLEFLRLQLSDFLKEVFEIDCVGKVSIDFELRKEVKNE